MVMLGNKVMCKYFLLSAKVCMKNDQILYMKLTKFAIIFNNFQSFELISISIFDLSNLIASQTSSKRVDSNIWQRL